MKELEDYLKLDQSLLNKLRGQTSVSHRNRLNEVVENFLNQAPCLLDQLREAVGKMDYNNIEMISQRLGVEFEMVGFCAAAQECRLISEAAKRQFQFNYEVKFDFIDILLNEAIGLIHAQIRK